MDNDELTRVTCEEDWLELREGERGIACGKLYGDLNQGDDGLIISNSAWELTMISIPDRYDGPKIAAGRFVEVIVERSEDGIFTTTTDIRIKQDEG